jgi:hypothetical protein
MVALVATYSPYTSHGGPLPNPPIHEVTNSALRIAGGPGLASDPTPSQPLPDPTRVEVETDADRRIRTVRIGRWREIRATPCRHLAEVRELSGGRMAVLVERRGAAESEAFGWSWQIYAHDGCLQATVQGDYRATFALVTNYATREVTRLELNRHGELQATRSWTL